MDKLHETREIMNIDTIATAITRNKRNNNNEYELTETETELTQTELTQTTQQMTEMSEFTQTDFSATQAMRIGTGENNAVIPIRRGGEIKCCHKIDIYTGLYIIFAYNALIALLLIAIIGWTVYTVHIAYLVSVVVAWCGLFLCIRLYIFIFGVIVIPQMVGLHGNQLVYLKEKYLKYINVWSVCLLYGPIVFNIILITLFVIYAVVLSGITQSIDKFMLFCMLFIGIIVIIDSICEIMFYDTVKKFMEAKLECQLCSIPCRN